MEKPDINKMLIMKLPEKRQNNRLRTKKNQAT